jgi:hypothetical protein
LPDWLSKKYPPDRDTPGLPHLPDEATSAGPIVEILKSLDGVKAEAAWAEWNKFSVDMKRPPGGKVQINCY